MKFLKHILIAAALIVTAFTARAQGQFDMFAVPRTIILANPAVRAAATSSNAVWIDIHGSQGIAKVDFTCVTNVGDGAVSTAILESSPDQTNWTAVSYGQATQYALLYTNSTYSSAGLLATNNTFLAGTLTTPVAATAGFVTPYIAPVLYTNTAAITLGTGVFSVGFNTADVNRYLRARFVIASSTNTLGAVLTVRRTQ